MNKITFIVSVCIISLMWLSDLADGVDQKNPKSSKNVTATATPSETPPARGATAPESGEQINRQVISSGGVRGTSTNFAVTGTAGQTAVGTGSSTNYRVGQGFWQSSLVYLCGDADASSGVDISDAVYLIAYIFGGGPAPNPAASGDADCSGGVADISDAVYLIAYIFGGGPAPCASCK